MKKEFLASNAKFIYSKNELGYQEVLDRFGLASEINIITFNISEKQNSLINALKNVGEDCAINIITNIPSRWEKYYCDSFRNKARQKINLYMSKLNPEKIGVDSAVFFDFSNHGKIIMTDSIIYVGSANYSEESANNTEFGFLSEDKELIGFVRTEVLTDIKASAIPYYEYDYTMLLIEANFAMSAVFDIKSELYEEVYRFHDDVDVQRYYYVENEVTLTPFILEKIMEIVDEACRVARDIYDAIDVIAQGDEDETISVNDSYEELLDISRRVDTISSSNALIELAEFDADNFVNEQLQDEYAMEAYEDDLSSCQNDALAEAQDKISDLTQAAKKDIDYLLDELQKFCDKYAIYIENLRTKKLKKINPNIDNT